MSGSLDPIRKRVARLNWLTFALVGTGFPTMALTDYSALGFGLFMTGFLSNAYAVFGLKCQRCGKAWWSWTVEERSKVASWLMPSINRRNPGIIFPLRKCQHCGQERA